MLQYWILYPFVFYGLAFWSKACGILAPRPGIEPVPSALEGDVLAPGPPGKSWLEFHRNSFIERTLLAPGPLGSYQFLAWWLLYSLPAGLFGSSSFAWFYVKWVPTADKALGWVAAKMDFSKHSYYPILLLKELSHVKSLVVPWFPAVCLISLQCRDAGSAESRERV